MKNAYYQNTENYTAKNKDFAGELEQAIKLIDKISTLEQAIKAEPVETLEQTKAKLAESIEQAIKAEPVETLEQAIKSLTKLDMIQIEDQQFIKLDNLGEHESNSSWYCIIS